MLLNDDEFRVKLGIGEIAGNTACRSHLLVSLTEMKSRRVHSSSGFSLSSKPTQKGGLCRIAGYLDRRMVRGRRIIENS